MKREDDLKFALWNKNLKKFKYRMKDHGMSNEDMEELDKIIEGGIDIFQNFVSTAMVSVIDNKNIH